MPAPTAWPFAMAMGTALMFTGLLTDASVSVLGAILTICGAVGWFRAGAAARAPRTDSGGAARSRRASFRRARSCGWKSQKMQRAWLPLKIYPVSAGVKGGLAGGVAMAILAVHLRLISYHSIWYPDQPAGRKSCTLRRQLPPVEAMMHFRMDWFLFALAMHITMCLLVGLLYGAMLPLLPRGRSCWAESLGRCCGQGLLYHIIGFVNPLLDQRINWWWFAVSQVAFGVVAGLVVARQNKVLTTENMPLAMRAGIEAPGLMHERDDEDKKR